MTYSEKLRDPRWQKKRLFILERDDWSCRDCKNDSRPLHIHHFLYERGKEPWDIDDRLLLTVCDECHASRQAFEDSARASLGLIFSKCAPEFGASFSRSMHDFAEAATGDCPDIIGSFRLSYLADVRWMDYALTHPEARPFYEHVTGNIGMTWPVEQEDAA